jgi:hypothetical protein
MTINSLNVLYYLIYYGFGGYTIKEDER